MTNKTKGILFMILGALFFSLMGSSVKFLENLPLMQKVFFRNFFAFIVALIVLTKNKQPVIGKNIPFLILRSILGYLGMVFNIYAISQLFLADASILQNTNPFFVIVFSLLFLNERFRKHLFPTLIFAFLGVLLVIKPQFDHSIFPFMIGLASGAFSGAAYVTVSYLNKTDSPQTIILYFSGISSLITFPFLLMGQYLPPTPLEWVGLFLIGLFGTLGQFCITNGYRYAPASELSIYNYTQILFVLVWGIIFWGEFPDALSILGGIFIVFAAYINYRYSIKESIS